MLGKRFIKQFQERTPKSREMYERACKTLPGGVAGNGKFLMPYPAYIDFAQGGEVVDLDGNSYVDLLMGGGGLILGHMSESVLSAVEAQQRRAGHMYLAAEAEVKMAEKVCQLMPAVDMVRFVNTGSEATEMAIRTARAYSGREKILKFEGNWHGQHPTGLVSALGVDGEANSPVPHIELAGIPRSVVSDIIIRPYNDPELCVETIEQYANELGAVIMEPVSAFGLGVVPANEDFLIAVRETTARHNIPLIFDEVVTNFRLALGGATEYTGIKPDLVAMGKILGGGYPIGGFGGCREIMEKVVTPKTGIWDLSTQIFQSGNYSGNPISMVAGLAQLEELEMNRDRIYPHINSLAKKMADGIQEMADQAGIKVLVNRVSSFFQVHFGIDRIKNKRDSLKADKAAANLFHLGLRANGVMASYHPLFLSAAHTDAHVDRVLAAANLVFSEMSKSD